MIFEQLPALIVVTPLILSIIVPLLGWINKKLCFPVVFIALLISFLSSIGILNKVMSSGEAIHYLMGGWEPPWGIEYVIDHLSALVLISVAFVALIVSVYAKRSVEKELPESKIPLFYTLLLLQDQPVVRLRRALIRARRSHIY